MQRASKGRVEVHALSLSLYASKITRVVPCAHSQRGREPILFTFEEGPASCEMHTAPHIH